MAGQIKVHIRLEGEVARVKSLVVHPMETGARKDPETGELVPRHHIERLTFANNGEAVMVADCSTAVAKNPYLTFSFRGASPGDRFTVDWIDNTGETGYFEKTIE